VAKAVHAVGGELFVDCVHFAPHGLIDIEAWDCDYLVCSGYKTFSPHMGFLWGKRDKLIALPTFREDFIPDEPPYKIEAGTFVYENVVGMSAVIDYLEALGREQAPPHDAALTARSAIEIAMRSIQLYEQTLSRALLGVLSGVAARIFGVSDPAAVADRVPTLCFTLGDHHPGMVAQRLADAGIGIRDGHMYAPRLMARLGLPLERGALRVSLVHYNTLDEIDRFAEVIQAI
jgi:selenocysteine lyase/cysteine desulfurase